MPESRGPCRFRPRRPCLAAGLFLLCGPMAGWPPAAPAAPALTCLAPETPPGSLPPCGASAGPGPTREPDLDTGIGNPVHRSSGEKFLREIDLPESLDGALPGFVRLYRSGGPQAGPLGSGWTSEYDIRLLREGTGWRLRLADGRRPRYGGDGRSVRAGEGRILPASAWMRIPAGGGPWARAGIPAPRAAIDFVWQGEDGQRLDFDAEGRLRTLILPGRAATHLEYTADGPFAGLLARIRRENRHLRLEYANRSGRPLLEALHTPRGTFRYMHDADAASPPAGRPGDSQPGGTPAPRAARLLAVRRPDGMQRRYHYEPAHQSGHAGAITGITLQDAGGRQWRARSWSYDRAGRVTLAIPGPRGRTAGRLELGYGTDTATEGAGVRRDARGRLAALDGLRIDRAPDGRIRRLGRAQGGWPGLRLDYDEAGRRTGWFSALTGATGAAYAPDGRLLRLSYANGDRLDLQFDATGRPAGLRHTGPGKAEVPITLGWHGRRLRRLEHPAETEYLDYDDEGRLRGRDIRRPHPDGALQYRESFAHDRHGRLLRHTLPEGGALHYRWSDDGRLVRMDWESRDGARHPVIETVPGRPGYRYGNGLHLQTRAGPDGRADLLVLSDGGRVLWGERRWHDARGRVRRSVRGRPGALRIRDFAYDAQDRLIGHQARAGQPGGGAGPGGYPSSRPATATAASARTVASANAHADTDTDMESASWLAWAEDGGLRGRAVAGRPSSGRDEPSPEPAGMPAITRDPSGLPLSIGPRVLRHQAQRRLAEVSQDGRPLARYTYNARGQQIRQRSATQEIERYYLDNRLAARWIRPPAPASGAAAPRFGVSERYLYALDAPVGLLRTDGQGRTQLFYVHADLLGAPVLATDARRAVRWAASYDALGRATRLSGDLALPLRLPGQDEDPATGWHDNLFRTYLPRRGHYLEPDPLGPVPGQQALGYAAQQPMRHADPLGLILLAFDGTRYGRANRSNVWKLAQAYADGPSFYHAGPGNNLYTDWDAVTAASSGQILRNQWQSLMNALQRAQGSAAPVPIDILGYSRGAALARDFANRIARQTRNGWFSYDDPLRGTIGLCVDLRFLGLFDTVAQFGLLGAANAGFDLGIGGAWSWVAHAVALHELRSLFPLVSAGSEGSANTVEAPFIGAHADIGGGLLLDEQGRPVDDGDLSDVALNWMRWQALAALLPLDPLAAADREVTRPWLHDARSPAQRLAGGDRVIQDAQTRPLGPQGADSRLGAAQRAVFEAFIQRTAGWEWSAGEVAGAVDMRGYGAWLESQLGLPGMADPPRQP